MAYYRILFGTGMAWLQSYVIKTDYPTTDYGALTDVLIDYLVANDKGGILDMENEYEWDEDGEKIYRRDDHSWMYYPDEFVVGGNYGNVLMHYGDFRIDEIPESEIGDTEVIEAP